MKGRTTSLHHRLRARAFALQRAGTRAVGRHRPCQSRAEHHAGHAHDLADQQPDRADPPAGADAGKPWASKCRPNSPPRSKARGACCKRRKVCSRMPKRSPAICASSIPKTPPTRSQFLASPIRPLAGGKPRQHGGADDDRAPPPAATGSKTRTARCHARCGASANAQGQTSAEQATTQAIGVLSSQLAQLQALQAAQARAIATERLERIAREERSREIRRRAFPTNVDQPTQPVTPRF